MDVLFFNLGFLRATVRFVPGNENQGEGKLTFTDGYSGADMMAVPECDGFVVINPNGVLSLVVCEDVMHSGEEDTTNSAFDNGFELIDE